MGENDSDGEKELGPKDIPKLLKEAFRDPEFRTALRETNWHALKAIAVFAAIIGFLVYQRDKTAQAEKGLQDGAEIAAMVEALAAHTGDAEFARKVVAECRDYLVPAMGAKFASNKLDNEFFLWMMSSGIQDLSDSKISKYLEAKGAFEKEFSENAEQWKACVRRIEQKKPVMNPMKPVAIQPKQVPRTGSKFF